MQNFVKTKLDVVVCTCAPKIFENVSRNVCKELGKIKDPFLRYNAGKPVKQSFSGFVTDFLVIRS